MKIKFKKLSKEAVMPTKAHPTDAGFDLYSSVTVTIPSGERMLIPTEVAMEIPKGYFGAVVGRSGNTIKRGLLVMTGIIDAGYRGPIGIMAYNLSNEDITIRQGEKASQIVIIPILGCKMIESDELSQSDRGENGYGSTGK